MLCFVMLGSVMGHGVMTLPSPRQGVGSKLPPSLDIPVSQGDWSHSAWFTNNVNPQGDPNRIEIPGNATNCEPFVFTTKTIPINCGGPHDPYAKKPWRAPGTAPILSPCGVLGGGLPCDVEGAWHCSSKTDGQGRPRETDGIHLPPTNRTVWKQGSTQQVAWSIQANHGGGYSWRLCPSSNELTEECFQKGHLRFAGTTSIVHWFDGHESVIPLVTTTNGTFPSGSQWARNPIPGDDGNATFAPFPAPCPGCDTCAKGACQPPNRTLELHNFSIIDSVVIPVDQAPGDYVLSWRWDCEVNPQVWTNCADVTIE